MDFEAALSEMRLPTPSEVEEDFEPLEVRELENKIREALFGFKDGSDHIYVDRLSPAKMRLAAAKLNQMGWKTDLDPEYGRVIVKKKA